MVRLFGWRERSVAPSTAHHRRLARRSRVLCDPTAPGESRGWLASSAANSTTGLGCAAVKWRRMGTVRSRSRTPALPRARCPLALRRHDARRRREPDLPDRDALCAVPALRARRPRMRSCAERGCSLRESVITPYAAAIEQRRLWANPWRAHAGCTTEPERVSHTTTGSGVVLMLAVSLWFYDGRGSRTLRPCGGTRRGRHHGREGAANRHENSQDGK